MIRPIPVVTAKPLIGPVPKINNTNAVSNEVRWPSIIAESACLKPSVYACLIDLPANNSSFVLS